MISSPVCALHNVITQSCDYSVRGVESYVSSDGVYHMRLPFNTLYNHVSMVVCNV